jgi:phosphatidylinositol 4-kinase
LAAYSLAAYVLQIKDRHNGNILLDAEGHLIHIDFGFILSMAPGGSFSLESAPFKLTEEMLEVMEGLESVYFEQFVRAFTSGFLALRDNSETIVATLSILAKESTFPCFVKRDTEAILEALKGRFRRWVVVLSLLYI